jgi:GH15 family glucan-1,4-alpha-glucosidase
LLVIAASKYIRESGDRAFAEHFWGKMQAAMNWLKSQRRKGMHLLSQSPYADWADSVARKGVVCYTNIVYWKALMEMAVSAQFLARRGEAYLYQESAAVVKAELQDVLWQPDRGYFATSPSMSNLSSGGNLLAIAWGLANQRQSESILNRMRDYGMAYPVPTQAAYPPYQRSKISIENRLGRIANYHTDGAWLWLGAWHIIALCKTGRNDRAQRLLARLAKIILRDQQIYEVYGLDSRPLSSIFYTAESPLTWNAGMLVYAYHILEQHLQIPSLVTK